jgi:SagB-type dehydrogenase family enzyme
MNIRNALILTGVLMMTMSLTQELNAAGRSTAGLNPLPAAERKGGMPLMEALDQRQSIREFSSREIPPQQLSNLLWAAWGYNREDQKKRTAPSSNNRQEISVYCAMKDGLYLYDAEAHALKKVSDRDIRKESGKQDFAAKAPLNLIFVADTNVQKNLNSSYANVGFISQNVYLYCASEGLGTVVRGWFDAELLHKAMELEAHQTIILCQTVGYPE